MKTSFAFVCIFLLSCAAARADQEFVPTQLTLDRSRAADVEEVRILASRIVVENTQYYQSRKFEIQLGIQSETSLCERITRVEESGGQSSLESMLNPTDRYFRVRTEWKSGCATGSYAPPQFNKILLSFWVDQRPIAQQSEPWGAPSGMMWKDTAVQQLNFFAGMMSGLNWWKLYRLDMTDIEHPKLEIKKTYAYVQGEVRTRP